MTYLRVIKRIAGIYIKTGIQQDMTYRFDFVLKLLNTLLNAIGGISGILIVFSQVDSINGWSIYETLSVTGVFMFIIGLSNLFIGPSLSSISGLGGDLWNGSFDFILLKPIPSQIYISIKKWSPMAFIDLIISLVVIGISVFYLRSSIGIGSVVKFFISIAISLVIVYSILLILSSVAFWYLGTPLLWIYNSIIELGRYPVSIYPKIFKFFLTWIIPVGFIVTMPAEALLGKAGGSLILKGAVLAFLILCISIKFYKISVKKYSSATS
jgi:ABC-2 type transport system permease protein